MSKVMLLGPEQMFKPNSPSKSKHQIVRYQDYRHLYITERILQKICRPLEGFSLLANFAPCDLIHSFNAILHTKRPWIITFESMLPRTIGAYGDKLGFTIRNQLLSDSCRKIIAMSDYASYKFLKIHEYWDNVDSIKKKIEIIHPSFPIIKSEIKKYSNQQPLEVLFIGNDFARKGGIVALRTAEKAKKNNLPIKFTLISGMNYGESVYTDCNDKSKYHKDLKLLELDNVHHYEYLPTKDVLSLLSKSHFNLLCTLDDTYGYSVLEGFSVGTPAITTNVCVLPEIVNHSNGFMIDLELNELRHWIYLPNRLAGYLDSEKEIQLNDEEYWSIVDETYENISNQVLEILINTLENPQTYEQLSAGAIAQAKNHDSAKKDDIYNQKYAEILECA